MHCFEYLRFKATRTPSMFVIAKLPEICLFDICLTEKNSLIANDYYGGAIASFCR